MSTPLASAWISVPLAALSCWLLLLVLLPLLRRGLLDQPNARSAHRLPTPRGGGVGFVLVSCLWGFPLVPLLCAPLALVGLLDDRLNLPAALRYGAQLATAIALVLAVGPSPIAPLLLAVALVAITAVINFFNFMDGLDGLVAGCSAVVFAVAAISSGASWLWPLVGALLGFLIWNWSPARLFMGDVGSTFLGRCSPGWCCRLPALPMAWRCCWWPCRCWPMP